MLPAPPASQPAVIATVNGQALTEAELNTQMDRMARQLSAQVPAEQLTKYLPQMRQQAVADLINKTLLAQECQKEGITVPDAAVKQQEAALYQNAPPDHTLDGDLQAAGMTRQSFEQELFQSLAVKNMLDSKSPATLPTDAQAQNYYDANPSQFQAGDTVSARHILVAFADGDDAAKKALKYKAAEQIRQRLLNGEDFAKVCAETSDDPGSKNNGGLYEGIHRGQMVPEFEKAAFSQKPGEIGPIIETSFGYHVLKVEKHDTPTTMPFAGVKDQLKDFLAQNRHDQAVQAFVQSLHDSAKITYAAGYAPNTQPATMPQ